MLENFWKDKYPAGVSPEIDPDQYPNVLAVLKDSCQRFANKPAFTNLGKTLTYGDLYTLSGHFAAYLQKHSGLQPGDRIAIQMPNVLQYPIAVFGAMRAGYVVVNTNPLYTAREMLHQFNDADVKAIVILDALTDKLATVINDTSIKTVIVAAAVAEPTLQEGQFSLNELIRQGERLAPLDAHQASRDDIAVLQYTGGTTGVAKAAMLSHGNILANAEQMNERFDNILTPGQETGICPLPLYHIYAFTVNMIGLFGMGEANLLIPNPRDLDSFVNAIKAVPFKGLAGINTLFVGLCQHPGSKDIDFSNLKITLSGGAALTHSAAHLWEDVTGCAITEGYGLSETSPVVSFNVFGEEELGTVGKPLEQTQVAAWNEHNQPVSEGEVGELVVKGPQVMKGYWQRDDETSKVMIDGWFKTGDMGLIQSNGNVKIVDRLKDMIIVSGFNVFPNEVEDVLSEHPAVMEAAVVGEADEKTGEAVKAFVTVNESVTQDGLREYCREHLTNYKVPKHIEVLEELPKSTVGKILRRELRKR